jgi:hypothetical protein
MLSVEGLFVKGEGGSIGVVVMSTMGGILVVVVLTDIVTVSLIVELLGLYLLECLLLEL